MTRRRRTSALYGQRPPGVSVAMWRAYGSRYPGGYRRWADQQAELAAAQEARLRAQARALWVRAHRAPDRAA